MLLPATVIYARTAASIIPCRCVMFTPRVPLIDDEPPIADESLCVLKSSFV